ncbi:MAG: cupin domain-containing protein [Dehalococcoidia bacterium]
MPFVKPAEGQRFESYPGIIRRVLLSKEAGAQALSIREVELQPGAAVPLHVHPVEKAVIFLEGQVEVVLGDTQATAGPNHALLVPPGVKHRLINASTQRVLIITIFPVAQVSRSLL